MHTTSSGVIAILAAATHRTPPVTVTAAAAPASARPTAKGSPVSSRATVAIPATITDNITNKKAAARASMTSAARRPHTW